MIIEIGRVFLCLALGDAASRVIPIPLPASVLGLLMLFGWLCAAKTTPAGLTTLADKVLEAFGLYFVPAGVGIIIYRHHIQSDSLAVVAAILVGTLMTIVTAGLTAAWMVRRDGEDKQA